MKPTMSLSVGLLLCVYVLPVFAQALTKAQEGRMAVGQCYSACVDTASKTSALVLDQLRYLTTLVLSQDFYILPTSLQDQVIKEQERTFCLIAQDHIRNMDACHAGCIDVEVVYGVKSSEARNRFHQNFRTELATFKGAGLWIDYRTPVEGAAFNSACDRLFSSSAQENSKSDKPLLLQKRLFR